ncbi:MAG TPA: nitrogen fixation protein NifQ [Candidatus Accumulibacter phosphatis]|nr:MAG: NifQ [Candidatus Accumulibacter sp. SK-11]HRL75686.1 nitrogen fixation protein NifQ [Candidatus Accumulibacter phosphatis]HRQ96060.1 nitrogen fixation protein NifQ [Candidatus Accumulibacter phosphatis]
MLDPTDKLPRMRLGEDQRTLALLGVVGQSLKAGRWPLIRGFPEERLQALLAALCPGTRFAVAPGVWTPDDDGDEFADLLDLLLEHLALPDESGICLCHAIATAAMGANHLWQDMGLPGRKALSDLLCENFPVLAAKNVGDMKWKKFFYRQLCERAGAPICKAPHCAECCDRALCFGPEEGSE